ncbi:MAG: ion transporter [Geminicoccaceae bacterium]|nr:ion transporter [Geminicoccaceae bacterium]
MSAEIEAPKRKAHPLPVVRRRLRRLYHGTDRDAALFQYALLAFDVATIAFFLTVSFVHEGGWIVALDILIGAVLALDFVLRTWVAESPWRHLLRPTTLADAVVVVALIAPAFVAEFAFLRVLRAIRLLRSYHVLGLLRRRFHWVRENEEMLGAIVNIVVFLFVVTAVVYVTQHGRNPDIANYADAFYFTVTTLTTTGFGDVTLVGTSGRLLAALVMIFGISLFIRLVQTAFRPAKVRHRCPRCGLLRHDPDAVHCKHCGTVIDIPNEGE